MFRGIGFLLVEPTALDTDGIDKQGDEGHGHLGFGEDWGLGSGRSWIRRAAL